MSTERAGAPRGIRNARPLSVVHVTTPGAVGGLESVVLALSAGHRERGHAVRVVATLPPEDTANTFVSQLRDAGVETTVLHLPRRAYLRERAALRATFARYRADVVHSHGFRADLITGSAAYGDALPTVTTAHGFNALDIKGRAYQALQRYRLRQHSAVVAVSAPLLEQLRASGIPPERLHLIRNGWNGRDVRMSAVAARRALRVPADRLHLGWVGRLTEEKGADILVRALPLLRDLPIDVSVIGDGPDQPTLRHLAAELGVADRISWHGVVPNAGQLFAGFDLFALSSRMEGTPMVLFEAMAAGAPIVATRVGGVGDVVSSDDAVLVPPRDPAALAAAIRLVCTDRDGASRRTAAARSRLVTEFGLDTWLTSYETLYGRVCASQRSPERAIRA